MKNVILSLSTAAAMTLTTASLAAPAAAANPTLVKEVATLQAETRSLKRQVRQLQHQRAPHKKHKKVRKALHRPVHFVTFSTSPFLGNRTSFTPFDLLYETSSNNEDLRLLEQKQALINKLHAMGQDLNRPIVEVSGGIEGSAHSTSGFATSSKEGINLSTAELDLNASSGPWASAFMSIDYSGSPVSSGNRAPNGKLYIKRGFATIGNLNVSPVYGSIGLMYVPFGRYSSGMLSSSLTSSMGRIRSEAALLGVSLKNGFFGSVYGFSGSQTSGGSTIFKQGGVNIAFKNTFDGKKGAYTVGAGWVSNIADAQGQQDTGRGVNNGVFGGFAVFQNGSTTSNNNLVHRVGGIDLHAKIQFSNTTLMTEYLGATRHYSAADMTFNAAGAKPKALHVELNYSLPFCQKMGSNIGVAYGHTWEALALNLPQDSYSTYFSTSLMKDTVESIEYRHDTDYSKSSTASGRGATTPVSGTGRSRNAVIAQIGVYF